VELEGLRYSGFNLFDPDNENLLYSIVQGEFNISGLQNKHPGIIFRNWGVSLDPSRIAERGRLFDFGVSPPDLIGRRVPFLFGIAGSTAIVHEFKNCSKDGSSPTDSTMKQPFPSGTPHKLETKVAGVGWNPADASGLKQSLPKVLSETGLRHARQSEIPQPLREGLTAANQM
jgi:hypothetical protein